MKTKQKFNVEEWFASAKGFPKIKYKMDKGMLKRNGGRTS